MAHAPTTGWCCRSSFAAKSRLRARLESGVEVALMLERGTILHDGDCLRAEDGTTIQVIAAPEAVTRGDRRKPLRPDARRLSLGNRHVPLQVGPGWLWLSRTTSLSICWNIWASRSRNENAPFEPEAGAYAAGGHHHHDDEPDDHHNHDHDH